MRDSDTEPTNKICCRTSPRATSCHEREALNFRPLNDGEVVTAKCSVSDASPCWPPCCTQSCVPAPGSHDDKVRSGSTTLHGFKVTPVVAQGRGAVNDITHLNMPIIIQLQLASSCTETYPVRDDSKTPVVNRPKMPYWCMTRVRSATGRLVNWFVSTKANQWNASETGFFWKFTLARIEHNPTLICIFLINLTFESGATFLVRNILMDFGVSFGKWISP